MALCGRGGGGDETPFAAAAPLVVDTAVHGAAAGGVAGAHFGNSGAFLHAARSSAP